MKFFFGLLILIPFLCYSQTDWQKWGKKVISYQFKSENSQRNYSVNNNDPGDVFTGSLVKAYWFFISDVDGDNCPFRPSCSSFFLQAVKETNLIQGSLMFFDRFTRDMDISNRIGYYARTEDGHLYDPPASYRLNSALIKYYPPSDIIKN
jgi:putative component of membrane protein insertase Oxa1/YidC/SpoIIIJ protein YidD